MMNLRKSQERGYFEIDWLKSYHSFSFGEYYDPEHIHFRALRVINHDFIAAGSGFPLHPHRDMEIITYVLRGAVAHKDSMGNQEQVSAGEVQVMTAGSGVRHSEFNPNDKQELELLQIWLLPDKGALDPAYGQKAFSRDEKLNRLRLIASKDQRDGSLKINQDVNLYASVLEKDRTLDFEIPADRYVWIQVARGEMEVNGAKLVTGDGLSISVEKALQMKALSDEVEFLLFDLN
jgi:redox-sensitive bicupin YhaK (pirin superfamily)